MTLDADFVETNGDGIYDPQVDESNKMGNRPL